MIQLQTFVKHKQMKLQIVKFQTADYLVLDGILSEPLVKTKKIVIQVHGRAGNFFTSNFNDFFAKHLTENNIAYLAFNNRGAEYITDKKVVVNNNNVLFKRYGMLHETIEESVYDIEAAISFARLKGYDDIALQGHSLGCSKIIYFLLKKEFDGVISLMAPMDICRSNDHATLDAIKQAKEYCSLNQGDKLIYDSKQSLFYSAKTLTSIWAKGSDSDLFRYRNMQINSALSKIQNAILIQIGIDDILYGEINKLDIIKYLQLSFCNAKMQSYLIKKANHGFVNQEMEITTNLINFLNRF